MHQVALAQRPQRRLRHPGVALHAAQQQRIPLSRQPLQQGTKNLTAKTREKLLVDSLDPRLNGTQQGTDLWNRPAQSLRILRSHQRRNLENPRRSDQHLRIPHQLFFLKDRRQQSVLDVDHHQRALVSLQRPPRDFGMVGARSRKILERCGQVRLLSSSSRSDQRSRALLLGSLQQARHTAVQPVHAGIAGTIAHVHTCRPPNPSACRGYSSQWEERRPPETFSRVGSVTLYPKLIGNGQTCLGSISP